MQMDRTETGTIVTLVPRGQITPLPQIQQLDAYWQGLRQGWQIPSRADVNPGGMDHLLGSVFLIERIAPGHARFRLAGQHILSLLGMDVRGMPVSCLTTTEDRPAFSDLLEQVFRRPARALVDLELRSGAYLARAQAAQMSLLPLLDRKGEITRALGCLICETEPGQRPQKLGLVRSELAPLAVNAKLAPAAAPGNARAPASEPVSDDTTAAPRATGFAEPQRPYLRLVKSDT